MKNSKTKKQSILVAVLAFLLVGVLAVGMSSAWFQDSDTSKKATVVLGDKVDISKVTDITTIITNDKVYLPGDTINDENLAITLTSTKDKIATDSLVRVKITTESTDSKATDLMALVDVTEAEAAGWFKVGDYYYFNSVVTPITAGQTINFKWKAIVPTSWENEYANQSFSVQFDVEAVQAKNITVEPNVVDGEVHPFSAHVTVSGTTVAAKGEN